jgi:hypothetical protein
MKPSVNTELGRRGPLYLRAARRITPDMAFEGTGLYEYIELLKKRFGQEVVTVRLLEEGV